MRFVLVIICSCLVAGCSFTSSYPTGWPPKQSVIEDQCPDISGTYNNLDIDSHRTESLFDLLTIPFMCGFHDEFEGTVKIEWLDEGRQKFSVQLQELNGDPKENEILERDQGDFVCEKGVIKIEYICGREGIVAGYLLTGNRSYYLASDRSLIAEDDGLIIGHGVVIIPFYIKGLRYFRWQWLGGTEKFTEVEENLQTNQLELLAEHGNSDAQLRLFKDFRGNNYMQSLYWLCQAADQGNIEARQILGSIYEHGGGTWLPAGIVPKDYKLAYVWYGLSDQMDGLGLYSFASQRLTYDQQLDAERALKNWRPGNCARDLGL